MYPILTLAYLKLASVTQITFNFFQKRHYLKKKKKNGKALPIELEGGLFLFKPFWAEAL